MRQIIVFAICGFILMACAQLERRLNTASVLPQMRYVAIGSSFAAGPGITDAADPPPDRCGRSANNYARQLARKRNLQLVDMSCGGAKTDHVLGPWSTLPPQIDAVTSDTRLVTVTIGGNDVGYIGCLIAASTLFSKHSVPQPWTCPAQVSASEETWQRLETSLERIAAEVRRRAPLARLIFVDYLTVLPEQGSCEATPLTKEQADASRVTARRLSAVTARVAQAAHVEILRASELSQGHDACAQEPWMIGFSVPNSVPYHPNLAGMTAIANALDRLLGRSDIAVPG